MAYSVMEGVAFRILSILEMLLTLKEYVTVSAGASDNNIMIV